MTKIKSPFRPRFWRIWGWGLRGGLSRRFRREGYRYEWRPLTLRLRPWRGAFAWWRRSLLDWHGVQSGWFGRGGRVMSQVYHVGPLLFIVGAAGRRPRRGVTAAAALALLAFALPAVAQQEPTIVLPSVPLVETEEWAAERAAWEAVAGQPADSPAAALGPPLYRAWVDQVRPVSLYVLGGDTPDLERARSAGATLTSQPFIGVDGQRHLAYLVRYPMRDSTDFDTRYGPGAPGWRWACPHAPHVGDPGQRQAYMGTVLLWGGYQDEARGRGDLQATCGPLWGRYFAANPVEPPLPGDGGGSTGAVSCAVPVPYRGTPRDRCRYFVTEAPRQEPVCREWTGWTEGAGPECCPGVQCPTAGPFCGDGACTSGEDHLTCTKDCPPPDPCGDGFCDAAIGESHATCPADCSAPPPGRCEPPAELQSRLDQLEAALAALLRAWEQWSTTPGPASTGRLETVVVP